MFTFSDLETLISERASAKPEQSYTARLLGKGINKCAEKFGEEAIEVVIAAVTNNHDELISETADVLFHLMVLLKAADLPLCDVLEELNRRAGQSGIEEKASRQSDKGIFLASKT